VAGSATITGANAMAYDYSQYGGVLVGRQDKVLTITLNSPETLNAFTGPMHTSMSQAAN
jgi:enoyl-CoA hydratase